MDILNLDEALIVINKPAGLAVLPDGWVQESPYLLKLLKAEYGPVWIVHRLDKVTSGVIVFARSADAHRSLSMQFEKHEAQKIYHALAVGLPDWMERSTSQRLRSNVGHKHRTIVDSRLGKDSKTTFRILERFHAHILLEARPLTGRTHQVRAHAAALRLPLLGDALYGAPTSDLIARPALHAFSLSFLHPESGQPVEYAAPYPEDFSEALRGLRGDRQ